MRSVQRCTGEVGWYRERILSSRQGMGGFFVMVKKVKNIKSGGIVRMCRHSTYALVTTILVVEKRRVANGY